VTEPSSSRQLSEQILTIRYVQSVRIHSRRATRSLDSPSQNRTFAWSRSHRYAVAVEGQGEASDRRLLPHNILGHDMDHLLVGTVAPSCPTCRLRKSLAQQSEKSLEPTSTPVSICPPTTTSVGCAPHTLSSRLARPSKPDHHINILIPVPASG